MYAESVELEDVKMRLQSNVQKGLLVLASVAMLSGGTWFYRYQRESLRGQVERNLTAIAQLKVDQITLWRRERFANATVIMNRWGLIKDYQDWLRDPASPAARRFLRSIQDLQEVQGYSDVLFVTTSGQIQFSLHGKKLCGEVLQVLKDALRARNPVLTELHVETPSSDPHLSVVAPLFAEDHQPIAIIILVCNAKAFLDPLIQTWPVPSETAETLLVRREGDAVLFLNELRHRSGTALKLRVPLTRKALPAVMGALGQEGFVKGEDYRGHAVVAVVRRIPDTSWVMVSKVDAAEAFAEWHFRSVLLLALLFSLTGLVVALLLFLMRRERRFQTEMLNSAENALRESDARLREAHGMAHLGYWQWNVKTGTVDWSEEVYRIFRLDPKTFVPTIESVLALSPWPGDHERDLNLIREATASHKPGTYEQRFLRPDKSVGYYFSTFQGKYSEEGELLSIVGTVQDITERKRAEEELRKSEAFTRAVMDNLPIGLAVNSLDPKVDFVYMNDNFAKVYRTTRAALSVPDAFWDAVYEEPVFREEIRQRVLQDCASGDPERMRWENVPITRKGEKTTFVSARNIPVVDKALMISIVWDVTDFMHAEAEREKMQAQLAQAQKMESVGRLAGGVAHDFNNLIMGVMGYAELALDKLPPDHPVREDLEEILNSARRTANLTRQLLAFARKETIAPRKLDLNGEIENMLKMLRHLIGEDIHLAWVPDAELWPVKMDPGQVDQMFANLCVNARDAIEGVGKITIETANVAIDASYCADRFEVVPGDYVMCAVSDDGCGMTQDVMTHIFDPFYTTKRVGEGTGLGLSTVFGIVKQNNGFINVYSEEGKGSTFRIYLPRFSGEAEQKAEQPDDAEGQGGGETILLVEDDKAVLMTTQAFLKQFGYSVLAAASPEEALRMAGEYAEPIHLLISDVILPGMNGRELARRLVETRPDIKILYMSGYTANVIAHRGILEEDVMFLAKPYTRDALSRKVREVLGSAVTRKP